MTIEIRTTHVEDADASVGAELCSLVQPDVIDGAITGEPNTFIRG